VRERGKGRAGIKIKKREVEERGKIIHGANPAENWSCYVRDNINKSVKRKKKEAGKGCVKI
jgi:hypothetical protein